MCRSELTATADVAILGIATKAGAKSAIRDPRPVPAGSGFAIPFGVRIAAVCIPQPDSRCAVDVTIPGFHRLEACATSTTCGRQWHRLPACGRFFHSSLTVAARFLCLKPSPTPGFSRGVGIPTSRLGAIRFTTACTPPARRCLVANQFLQGMPAAAANIGGGDPQSLLALPLLSRAHGRAIPLRNPLKHFRRFMFYRAGHPQSIRRLLPQAARRQ